MMKTGMVVAALALVAACSQAAPAASHKPTHSPSQTHAPTTAAATPVVEDTWTPPPPNPPPALFPHGYPKVVRVSKLPEQVRSWYRMSHYRKAVAVAPGVWTPLPPGASKMDAATSGVLDGFCASIKSYERKYLDGQSAGGACW
jgi:hypothetical protein